MTSKVKAPTLEELTRIRAFLDSNPDMFKTITGRALGGRKKGQKNHEYEEGTVIEVEEPVVGATPEQAKQVLKKARKPRNMSEETKEKMKDILAKGREALRLKREAEKAQKEQAEQTKVKTIKKSKVPDGYEGEVVVKKYIVKRPQSATIEKPKKVIRRQVESEDDISEDETEFTTESESDTTLMRKIKKKGKVLKKLDSMLESNPPPLVRSSKRDIFRR